MKAYILSCSLIALLSLGNAASVNYEEDYETETGHLVLFIFFGLAAGAIATHVLSRLTLQIPYTVVVFILGMVLAGLIRAINIGNFGASVYAWKNMDADLILFLFLPPLLFGEAMHLNWHHVKGTFWQCVLLAGPGVLLGAALTAAFIKYLLPFEWSWLLCLVFGSIVTATDPVAVVSILKSSGASPTLTMIIIGESLLNDGTAMVLFGLFFGMLEGAQFSTGRLVRYFLKMTLGSPFFGVVCGLLGVYLLGRANRPLSSSDVTTQIATTLCVAYTVFVLAQSTLGLSGVLSCCGAGIMFAWLAPSLILQREAMNVVWSTVEWIANTLIFLLAGLIIGTETMRYINWTKCGYLLLLYGALMVIRFVVVFSLLPLLSLAGQQPITVKEAVVMSWSGLRGAMSITLALMVKASDETASEANELFFYVGGLAALTLLINAVTVTPLLKALEVLESQHSSRKMILAHSLTRSLRRQIRVRLADLLEEEQGVRVETVVELNTLLRNEEVEVDEIMHGGGLGKERLRVQLDVFLSRDHRSAVDSHVMLLVRRVFLNIVRTEYWSNIESGRLPRAARYTSALLYSIDKALDRVDDRELHDWRCLRDEMEPSSAMDRILSVLEACGCASIKSSYYLYMEESHVYLLTNFIDAHEKAQKKISDFLGQDERHSHAAVLPEEAAVIELSLMSVSEARKKLRTYDHNLRGDVSSRQVARALLKTQSDIIEKMVVEGLLIRSDAESFLKMVTSDSSRIDAAKSIGGNGAVSSKMHDGGKENSRNKTKSSLGGLVNGMKANILEKGRRQQSDEKYIALGFASGEESDTIDDSSGHNATPSYNSR